MSSSSPGRADREDYYGTKSHGILRWSRRRYSDFQDALDTIVDYRDRASEEIDETRMRMIESFEETGEVLDGDKE
jgi:hypothetical protein